MPNILKRREQILGEKLKVYVCHIIAKRSNLPREFQLHFVRKTKKIGTTLITRREMIKRKIKINL
jgi:hypothetical protein